MVTFFSLGAARRIGENNQLMKISKMINWGRIDYKVRSVNKNLGDGKSGGVVPYDALSMFKAILLQNWHSLSDKELEDALNVRIDFMLFCDFDLMNNIPDETTICRFRNRLIEKNLLHKLLTEINSQLEESGLKVKKADMAIVDATIIESASRPRMKILEEVAIDRNETDTAAKDDQTKKETVQPSEKQYQETISADPDAKWLKKGTKFYFGYKSFATIDEDGFVINTHTTPANEAEVNKLEIMTNGISANRMSGDKAYDSKANREFLKKKNIKSGLMFKAKRNQPLTHWQKLFNKLISKKRFRVEQSFGTLKRKFKFRKASYQTTMKVQAQFTLKAICLNLLKAVNRIEVILPQKQLQTG